jgi:hypothetical protein
VPRALGGPIGASVYRVALQGGQPAVADSGGQKLTEILRTVSKFVAENIGPKAKIATAVVWLSIDGKRLHDRWIGQDTAGAERLAGALRLTGDAFDTLGTVKGLGLAGQAAATIYVLVDLGDSLHQGSVTLSAADLAGYAGVEGAEAELLKLPDLMQ